MKIFNLFIALGLIFFAISCEEEEFEPATVAFYPTLNYKYIEKDISLNTFDSVFIETSRQLTQESQIRLTVSGNAKYGENYYTYPPQFNDGELIINFEANSNRAFFVFYPLNDSLIVGRDYTIKYELTGATGDIKSVSDGDLNIIIVDNDQEPSDCFHNTENAVIIDELQFENCEERFELPEGLFQVYNDEEKTDRGWGCTFDSRNTITGAGLEVSAFGGSSGELDTWLILGPYDLTNYETIELSVFLRTVFEGNGEMHFWYSNNYSGKGKPRENGATWLEMSNVIEQLPEENSAQFVEINTAPCLANSESVYFALQFVGGTNNSSRLYSIDDLTITGIEK